MSAFSELQANVQRLQAVAERGDLNQIQAELSRVREEVSEMTNSLAEGHEGADPAQLVKATVNSFGQLQDLYVSPKAIQQGGENLSDAIVAAVGEAHNAAAGSVPQPPAMPESPAGVGPDALRQQLQQALDEHVPRDMGFLRDMFVNAMEMGLKAAERDFEGEALDGAICARVDVSGQLLGVEIDRAGTRDLDNESFAEAVMAAVAQAHEVKAKMLQPRMPAELDQLLDASNLSGIGLPDPRDTSLAWPPRQ
ncbi:YbaB/EbfC family nucleoid-associated protein [Enemella sp. A6]|uniref:YbaB/EbfC family nucleoid-associated protein n=1 Tax=Enemella sp. A6 TaxID=3440152 RepID=UPI003EBDF370